MKEKINGFEFSNHFFGNWLEIPNENHIIKVIIDKLITTKRTFFFILKKLLLGTNIAEIASANFWIGGLNFCVSSTRLIIWERVVSFPIFVAFIWINP